MSIHPTDPNEPDRSQSDATPDICQIAYGEHVERGLYTAVHDALTTAGIDTGQRQVWSVVDLEQVDRLTDDRPFELVVEVAGGRLEITECTVLFDAR